MKLSIPSLASLVNQLISLVKRFPISVLFAFIGTFTAISGIIGNTINETPFALRIMLCCELGLVLSIAITTFSDSFKKRKAITFSLWILLVLLLVIYYYSISLPLIGSDWYRFLMIAAIGHLLVAVAPFYRNGHINAFWQYNKALFLRFLTAVLYSFVLYLGISITIVAIKELFDIDIQNSIFIQLWWLIAGIFNTCMFLSGIPENIIGLDNETQYPKGLKIFTQFVLIPLVSIYVVILLAYELRILFQWNLPHGWVANLIIAFAVFGILSLLLVFPIRNNVENKWIVIYSKVYYWLLLPLLILLFIAIFIRINNYGFTEERFWVVMIGIWLLFISSYFIISKEKNIKLIPTSLALIILVSTIIITPICRNNQQRRLVDILSRNHLLYKGKFMVPKGASFVAEPNGLRSVIEYLYNVHGINSLQPYFSFNLDSLNKDIQPYVFTDKILFASHISSNSNTIKNNTKSFDIDLDSNSQNAIDITGFDRLFEKGFASFSYPSDKVWQEGDSVFEVSPDRHEFRLIFKLNGEGIDTISLNKFLGEMIQEYKYQGVGSLDDNDAILFSENNHYKVKLFITSLSTQVKDGQPDYKTTTINYDYLIQFKK